MYQTGSCRKGLISVDSLLHVPSVSSYRCAEQPNALLLPVKFMVNVSPATPASSAFREPPCAAITWRLQGELLYDCLGKP